MISALKNVFVILGLLLIAGLGYYLFTTNGSFSLETSEKNLSLETESTDLIRKLDSLKKITIDKNIFSDPRFTNLRDYGTPIPVYPVGRENPFTSPE